LRARAAGATKLDESKRMMESALADEKTEADRLPELERLATVAEERAASVAHELEIHLEALGAHRTASHQAELERARWRDRVEDLRRQLRSVEEDLAGLRSAADERARRLSEAQGLGDGRVRDPAWSDKRRGRCQGCSGRSRGRVARGRGRARRGLSASRSAR